MGGVSFLPALAGPWFDDPRRIRRLIYLNGSTTSDGSSQFNLGHLYGRLGRPEDHLEMWRAAIRSNPEFVLGYYHLAKLHMDRGDDLDRAELLVREGLHRDPDGAFGPFGYFVLADILNRKGRLPEAREAVENGRRLQARG